MSSLFCCSSINGYRPQILQHQDKFNTFMRWAGFPRSSSPKSHGEGTDLDALGTTYVVQLVRQVNYGPLESKRYFAFVKDSGEFVEVVEGDLVNANFQKLNSFVLYPPAVYFMTRFEETETDSKRRYKNFRCEGHNKFFEVNLYQKDPVNKHY